MDAYLPTCAFGSWTITSLRDSLVSELDADRHSSELIMYFYAVTQKGWDQLRMAVVEWRTKNKSRQVSAYIGTDHAVTDPDALEQMNNDGVSVYLMERYKGVFHPKVVWLRGKRGNNIWVGSNNLTGDGLLNNIEFAMLVRSKSIPAQLKKWGEAVASGGSPFSDELLNDYREQRNRFDIERAKTKARTFTWRRKQEPTESMQPSAGSGDLVLEIMPRETGADGRQIQIPVGAARSFFNLAGAGATKQMHLKRAQAMDTYQVTMTAMGNHTVRLSLRDLEYRDRPCVVIFRKRARARIEYEIVSESIYPNRYRELLRQCGNQTRSGSRRWTII